MSLLLFFFNKSRLSCRYLTIHYVNLPSLLEFLRHCITINKVTFSKGLRRKSWIETITYDTSIMKRSFGLDFSMSQNSIGEVGSELINVQSAFGLQEFRVFFLLVQVSPSETRAFSFGRTIVPGKIYFNPLGNLVS